MKFAALRCKTRCKKFLASTARTALNLWYFESFLQIKLLCARCTDQIRGFLIVKTSSLKRTFQCGISQPIDFFSATNIFKQQCFWKFRFAKLLMSGRAFLRHQKLRFWVQEDSRQDVWSLRFVVKIKILLVFAFFFSAERVFWCKEQLASVRNRWFSGWNVCLVKK